MNLHTKIASALQSLLGTEKKKKAEHVKTLDLFGFPAAVGDELIDVEDPQETPIEAQESEQINEDAKGEDTIADELTTPEQSEGTITGTGAGSEY